MGIQDLGAIGEFISSLVIVFTLVVLIYEVRGSKQATLSANAQERQNKRDDIVRSIAESSVLGRILETANHHLGVSRSEIAAEFGLEADQYLRLNFAFGRLLNDWRAAFVSDLSAKERAAVDLNARLWFSEPAVARWYDLTWSAYREGDFGLFLEHLDEIRASVKANA